MERYDNIPATTQQATTITRIIYNPEEHFFCGVCGKVVDRSKERSHKILAGCKSIGPQEIQPSEAK